MIRKQLFDEKMEENRVAVVSYLYCAISVSQHIRSLDVASNKFSLLSFYVVVMQEMKSVQNLFQNSRDSCLLEVTEILSNILQISVEVFRAYLET